MCAVLSSIFCSFQNRYNRLNVYNASASSSLDRSSNQVTLKGFFLTIHGNNAWNIWVKELANEWTDGDYTNRGHPFTNVSLKFNSTNIVFFTIKIMFSIWDALVKCSPSGNMEKRIKLETANNCDVIVEISLIHRTNYSIGTARECFHWTWGVGLSSYWDHSNNPGIKTNTQWSCSYVESFKKKSQS